MIHTRPGQMAYLQDKRESVPAEWDEDVTECVACNATGIDRDGFTCEECGGARYFDEFNLPIQERQHG